MKIDFVSGTEDAGKGAALAVLAFDKGALGGAAADLDRATAGAVARAIATTAGLAKLAPGAAWVTVDRMTERALPTVMRKIIAHASQA